MKNRKLLLIITCILLFTQLLAVTKSNAAQPIGIAGFIYDNNGNPIPNHQVNITNINKSITKTINTNLNGMFAVSINADDGDIIEGNFSYNGKKGIKQITADLSLITHWLNISLSTQQPPIAKFTYNPKNPSSNTKISFIDLSFDHDGSVVYWKWDFGDNTISYERNPEHIYGQEGEFKVVLMVMDDDGYWSSTWDYVRTYDDAGNNTDNIIIIPPLKPPLAPYEPYTVPEMYHMLKIDKIGKTEGSVKVAVIDSGITYREYEGFNMYLIEALKIPSLTDPYDENGHGTWCNWAVYYGVAGFTNGKQYSIRVIRESYCTYDDLIYSLNYAKKLGVDVISISLGGAGSVNGVIAKKIDELRKDGIIVVCAAGNYGPTPSTIITPALSPSAIAVGSVNPQKTLDFYGDDTVSIWSSRGVVPNLKENKPDIVAGGESIIGAWLYGEKIASGTSMATPIVAGGCAVVYAKHEKLWNFLKGEYNIISLGNILGGERIVPFIFEYSLEKTAYSKEGWDGTSYGHGIPQFDKMEEYAFKLGLLFAILPFIIASCLSILFYKIHKKYGFYSIFAGFFKIHGTAKHFKNVKNVKNKKNEKPFFIEKFL